MNGAYPRLDIDAEAKEWNMSELPRVIADALARSSEVADPRRLAEKTRNTLAHMPNQFEARTLTTANVLGVAGATQPVEPPRRVTGGTIEFPGYSADDVEPASRPEFENRNVPTFRDATMPEQL